MFFVFCIGNLIYAIICLCFVNGFWVKYCVSLCIKCINWLNSVCCLLTNFTVINDLGIIFTLSYVVYFGLQKRAYRYTE